MAQKPEKPAARGLLIGMAIAAVLAIAIVLVFGNRLRQSHDGDVPGASAERSGRI